MSFTGTTEAQRIRHDVNYVVGQGYYINDEYHGGYSDINGLFRPLLDTGFDIDISREPPYSRLTATKQSSLASDREFYDRYTMTRESVQKSIWTHEDIESEKEWDAAGKSFEWYKDIIESAVSNGDEEWLQIQMPAVIWPVAWKIYRDLVKGAEDYEDEYTTLTRERVVGVQYVAKLTLKPGNASLIYTTDQLLSQFNIPQLTGIGWPSPYGIAKENTVWGWRSRRQDVRYVEGQKVEVTEDWAYAQWSTFLYTQFS